MEPDAGERHFNSAPIALAVARVRSRLGDAAAAKLLRDVGETRDVDRLIETDTWSTCDQVRRLLRATRELLGGLDEIVALGRSSIEQRTYLMPMAMVQEQLTPDEAVAYAEHSSVIASSLYRLQPEQLAPGDWRVTLRLDARFEPFPELCAYVRGQFEAVPTIFGLPGAMTSEESCACRGDDACRMRVRWDSDGHGRDRDHYLASRVEVLEAQLAAMRESVADLVAGGDLDELLERLTASIARGLIVHEVVLVLDALPGLGTRLSSCGVSQAAAARIADRLARGQAHWDPRWMVAPVTSQRRTYGSMVAVRSGGPMPDAEFAGLQSYARLAAAALDSATAIEAARHEANVANTLLQLSMSLAEITTLDEMAARLVRAVPVVVGADRATLALRDGATEQARVVACHGYPPEVEAFLRTLAIPPPAHHSSGPTFIDSRTAHPTEVAAAMRDAGSAAGVWVPIVVDGDWAGALVVSVTHDPDRLRLSPDVEARLLGLAGQASTAIRNARLLDQVRHQALHDSLTGLPNRGLIIDRVEQMLARAVRCGEPAAAMFVDLDGFKDVNDTFGHGVGDQLLRAVADRLAATLRASDTIGRLGGDEFIILLEGHSLDAGPEVVAERILDVLREPFVLESQPGNPLRVSASIGVAVGMRESAGELLRDADIALYNAKDAGKGCYVVFEPAMQTVVQDRLLLQMDLQGALAREEFFLLYQPVSELRSGLVIGVEALLRWQHPIRGVIEPATFLPLLDESGLIVDVGRWVLQRACERAVEWFRQGRRLHVAVNVSARQLQSDCFLADIDAALGSTGLDPASLVVEITETAIMRDPAATAARLRAVKERGVRVAIDDFGTGYSSLAYLRQFPVDTLKIDQSFVAALGGSPEAIALVHTLVQLGKTLGLETVAEGIEEPPQLLQLQAEDCDTGQGYLFARPLTSEELDSYLDQRHPVGIHADR